jgi:hypothetical protein
MSADVRTVLEKLCAERGEDFAGLSRMIGRNPAYIQQFVRRGVPRRLKEADRRKLARYSSVPESVLGGPESAEEVQGGLVPVKRTLVRASAGPGAFLADESSKPYFAFDEWWLRALTGTAAGKLSIIRVEGDSMAPTLNAGGRHPRRPRRLHGAASRRHLRASCRRRAGGQAAGVPSRGAAGDDPVGQPGLPGLA